MLRVCDPVVTPRLMAVGCVGAPTTVTPRTHRRTRDRINNSVIVSRSVGGVGGISINDWPLVVAARVSFGRARRSENLGARFAFATRLSTHAGSTEAAAAPACSGTLSWVWSVLCGLNEARGMRRVMGEFQFAYELPRLLVACSVARRSRSVSVLAREIRSLHFLRVPTVERGSHGVRSP